MDTIKIGSFNVKDNFINYLKGGIRSNEQLDNAQILADIIKDEKFDLLGTQELTANYTNRLKKQLPNYKLVGNYRYGNGILSYIPENENNKIITNREVILEETIWLPWLPKTSDELGQVLSKMSIMPRIATITITGKEHERICMINTHLDYAVDKIQIRELEALKKLIDHYSKKYPVVLTGDFNMEIHIPHFASFIESLEENHMKRVPIDSATWKAKTLDHIFIPEDWPIEDYGIITKEEMNVTSDHNLVYVKTKFKGL